MLKEAEYCKKLKKDHFNQPMNLTNMEEEEFAAATECHIDKNTLQRMTSGSEIIVILQENIEARHTINVIEALN